MSTKNWYKDTEIPEKHQNNSQNEIKIVNEHMKYVILIKLDSKGKNLSVYQIRKDLTN